MVVEWDFDGICPLVMTNIASEFEHIVSFPMKNGGSFHSYVSHYQRVTITCVRLFAIIDDVVIDQHVFKSLFIIPFNTTYDVTSSQSLV